jgi:D-lactate dehydrogenase
VANACVECGFCEPVCPSRDLTTTPRQRILIRRELARQAPGSPVQRALLEQYEYDGLETCAADGTCEIACPVSIDTGKLIKEFRGRQQTPRSEARGRRIAERWASMERLARGSLRAGRLAGPAMRAGAGAARSLLSDELVPSWPSNMPLPAPAYPPATSREGATAVYLPACVNRIFGRPRGDGSGLGLQEAMVELSARAGQPVWIPEDAPGHCCGVPWLSKGYREGADLMGNRTVAALWSWSGEGELPVVIDASSCTLGLTEEVVPRLSGENAERHGKLEILDSVAWAHQRLLPNLEVPRRLGSVAVHPTCSTRNLGLTDELRELAAAVADEVTVPIQATCCGMAGDRGLLHPELTRAATTEESAELIGRGHDAYLCSNRTCEIALEQGTGAPYESLLITLEALTRPGLSDA